MIAGLVLASLVVAAGVTARRGVAAGYVLVVVSIAWLLVDKHMEGVTLLRVTHGHGLTAGDLAGLAGIGLGLRQAWPGLARRRDVLVAAARERSDR